MDNINDRVTYEIYKTRRIKDGHKDDWKYHGTYIGSVLHKSLSELATALVEDIFRFKKVDILRVDLVSNDPHKILSCTNQNSSLSEDELAKLAIKLNKEYSERKYAIAISKHLAELIK